MEQRRSSAFRSGTTVAAHGGRVGRRRGPSATEKLVAVGLALLAIASTLFVGRAPTPESEEEEEGGEGGWASRLLPLVLVLLILAINIANLLDSRYTRFDPYWIHRVGGSSGGIVALLFLLALVLRCKASVRDR